jgi:hypothetical protein
VPWADPSRIAASKISAPFLALLLSFALLHLPFSDALKTLCELETLIFQSMKTGSWSIKIRVTTAFSLLILSKIFNVLIPQTYKYSVDSLSADPAIFPTFMILAYGALRLMSSGTDNLVRFRA